MIECLGSLKNGNGGFRLPETAKTVFADRRRRAGRRTRGRAYRPFREPPRRVRAQRRPPARLSATDSARLYAAGGSLCAGCAAAGLMRQTAKQPESPVSHFQAALSLDTSTAVGHNPSRISSWVCEIHANLPQGKVDAPKQYGAMRPVTAIHDTRTRSAGFFMPCYPTRGDLFRLAAPLFNR